MVRSFSITKSERIRMIDPVLLIGALILNTMSILTLYGGLGGLQKFSASALLVQIVASFLGLTMMTILSIIDYEDLTEKLWIFFFIASIGLLGITLVFGTSEGTNQSYLRFGPVGIQPSEFVKASFIITFSRHLTFVRDRINSPKAITGLALHAGVILGLILLSGDLGVALVYIGLIAIMLFCAGLSMWYILGAALIVIIAFPYIWPHLEFYQQQRILVGFNPELDPLDKGFQPLLSRQAIANGGLFGQGIHGGSYYKKLPAAHTDFIFATFCEKFGFIGGILLILVLVIMVVRILMIAHSARKPYGSYICVGAAALIILQTLENTGMCMAFLPVVGITLPFMSYGGSSMMSMYIILGLVQSVRAHRGKYFFDRAEE